MDLTDLPNDVFLTIVSYLSPQDCLWSRRVSRKWYTCFTERDLNRHVLRQWYPCSREVRQSSEQRNQTLDLNWAFLLSKVCARYHYLKSGRPRCLERLGLARSFVLPEWSRNYRVASWERNLSFDERVAQFYYPDTLWTYDDGLLIFPSSDHQKYVLYDIEARTFSDIAFDPIGKIVRRIRLLGRVLVIEWCESSPYHNLNENETVHRHFSTIYDVLPDNPSESQCSKVTSHEYWSSAFSVAYISNNYWTTRFRNEIKIHFLGLPLNSRDRFFSSHDSTHYALMVWQPNRSAWGEDEPLESIAIWDISSRSDYRPSSDPTGKDKPEEGSQGPRLLRRLSFSELDFYNIRQRSTPTLRELQLDENHVYVVEEDHRWLVGTQAGHHLPRLHKVKTVGIPFGAGPRWQDECGADGDVDLSFCRRVSDIRGPWRAPCWRHEEFPYLTITEAVDEAAGVRFCARHCFMLETISISFRPSIHMTGPGYEISLRDNLWQQLLEKGKIVGDERWLIGENSQSEIVILHFDRDDTERGR